MVEGMRESYELSSFSSDLESGSSCTNTFEKAAFQYKPMKKYEAFEYLKTNQLHGTKLSYSIDPAKNNNVELTTIEKQKMILF